jgi:hypothetical protein
MKHCIAAATYIEANGIVSMNKWESKIWTYINKKPWNYSCNSFSEAQTTL